jgi:hypothetical protein
MKPFPFTQWELRSWLDYDPATGIFRWRQHIGGRAAAGDIAGSQREDGYWRIVIRGRRYYSHRLAWFYVHGEMPRRLDHRDTDPGNNAIGNLRPATQSQNIANKRQSKNNTTGFKGVSLDKRRGTYDAYLTVKRQRIYLGSFRSPEDAHAAYMVKAREQFGEFARSH